MSCPDTTTIQVGDKPRVSTAIKNQAGNYIDPATVYAKIKDPSGHVVTYHYGVDPELQKESVGIYYVDVDADEAGTWYYRFYSTGSGQAAGEASFVVETTQF